MPSESSSPDPNAICACGHAHVSHTNARCVECEALSADDFMHAFKLPRTKPFEEPIVDVELPEEPKAPSPHDRCTCGHKRKKHHGILGCHRCYAKGVANRYHPFELAPLECEGGCVIYTEPPCDLKCCGGEWWAHGCKHSLPPEEEPPCLHESWEVLSETPSEGGWLKTRKCADCGVPLGNVFEADSHWDIRPAPVMPRRPPYAVAYAITGGHLYEVLLPGDARVTAEDGILKISHPSAVLALVQAGPMEVADAADAEE